MRNFSNLVFIRQCHLLICFSNGKKPFSFFKTCKEFSVTSFLGPFSYTVFFKVNYEYLIYSVYLLSVYSVYVTVAKLHIIFILKVINYTFFVHDLHKRSVLKNALTRSSLYFPKAPI